MKADIKTLLGCWVLSIRSAADAIAQASQRTQGAELVADIRQNGGRYVDVHLRLRERWLAELKMGAHLRARFTRARPQNVVRETVYGTIGGIMVS